MSRIGKKPVPILEKVKVAVSGNTVKVEVRQGNGREEIIEAAPGPEEAVKALLI